MKKWKIVCERMWEDDYGPFDPFCLYYDQGDELDLAEHEKRFVEYKRKYPEDDIVLTASAENKEHHEFHTIRTMKTSFEYCHRHYNPETEEVTEDFKELDL